MDRALFEAVNGMAGENDVLDQLMVASSSYFLYGFILLIIALCFFRKTRRTGWTGIFAIVLGLAVNFGSSFLVYRDRPFVTIENVTMLIEKGISASFPSDQATIAFTVSFIILYTHRKLGSAVMLLAIVTGFSRVYVGHHYPGDIIGGFFVALLCSWLSNWIIETRTNQTSKETRQFSI